MSSVMNLLATAPEGFEDVMENWNGLIYGVIVPIIFGVVGGIMLILGIVRAVAIASAENEDSKKKAVKAMIWWLVGFILCFVAAFATPALYNWLSGTFPVPTG